MKNDWSKKPERFVKDDASLEINKRQIIIQIKEPKQKRNVLKNILFQFTLC